MPPSPVCYNTLGQLRTQTTATTVLVFNSAALKSFVTKTCDFVMLGLSSLQGSRFYGYQSDKVLLGLLSSSGSFDSPMPLGS